MCEKKKIIKMRTHKISNLLGNLPDRVACWFTQVIVANVVEALRCFNKYFWTTFFNRFTCKLLVLQTPQE